MSDMLTVPAMSTTFKRPYLPEVTNRNLKPQESRIPHQKEIHRPTKRSKATVSLSPSPSPSVEPPTFVLSVPVNMIELHAPPAVYSGNMDLYGMYLPFLCKVYFPPGMPSPNYASLYETILNHQAKHDYTARCYLGPCSDVNTLIPSFGRFESSTVLDPMMERPFDMNITSFVYKKILTFRPTERSSLAAPDHSPTGAGIIAQTSLPIQCGINASRGVFKIKRAWVKQGAAGEWRELFEGYFSFSVSYDNMYKKAGHGNGAKYKFGFWGVRAMRDNAGKEIGLGPRKSIC